MFTLRASHNTSSLSLSGGRGGGLIQIMRVSKLPQIRLSRYGREKWKCWSQIALVPMAERRFPGPCS